MVVIGTVARAIAGRFVDSTFEWVEKIYRTQPNYPGQWTTTAAPPRVESVPHSGFVAA